MNILIVAPSTDSDAEAQDLALILGAVLVNGYVTRKRVVDAIAARHIDILWFVAHGDSRGVSLSNEHMSTADLTAVVRVAGASLVVLNTCSSEDVAYRLHYELNVSVIATIADVGEASAYQTGVLFARQLAGGASVADAFAQARPGGGDMYRLIEKKKTDL